MLTSLKAVTRSLHSNQSCLIDINKSLEDIHDPKVEARWRLVIVAIHLPTEHALRQKWLSFC